MQSDHPGFTSLRVSCACPHTRSQTVVGASCGADVLRLSRAVVFVQGGGAHAASLQVTSLINGPAFPVRCKAMQGGAKPGPKQVTGV